MTDSEFRGAVIAAIFRRRGAESSNTRFIENFPETVQVQLQSAVSLDNNELPILASLRDRDRYWVLITTRRILVHENEGITEVTLDDIERVQMRVPQEQTGKPASKFTATEILLKLFTGSHIVLSVEEGRPYGGILSILHHVASRNVNARDRTTRQGQSGSY